MALIICPKCGKQFSDRADKCPQCGITKEDAVVLLKKQEEIRLAAEREAAERERLRKEQEAKEAEEDRIRAEQRAEWWKQNEKKVRNASLISIVILLLIIIGLKGAQAITAKHAIAEANTIIEQADALIATYQFDEAYNICESGLWNIDNEKARHIVIAKETDIKVARTKADAEYEEALNKLRILLDADDNKFNQYSNSYLDRMIEIYPNRQESIYFMKIRNNPKDRQVLESIKVDGRASASTLNH